MGPRACLHWDDAVGLVPFVHDVALQVPSRVMPAPAGVPVVCVGHAVLGDLGVVVLLDVPDALVVLAVLIVLAVLVGVHELAVLGVVDAPSVLVLAVLGVVDALSVLVLAVLGVVDVLSVHVHVFGVPGLRKLLPPLSPSGRGDCDLVDLGVRVSL